MAEQTVEAVKKYASFKDLVMTGDDLVMDYTDDAWGVAALPPGGKVYEFKWVLDKEGITEGFVDKERKGGLYYNIHLVGTLKNDKEWEGTQVDAYLSTRVQRGKNISTAAGFLTKAGVDIAKNAEKMKKRINHVFIVEMIEKFVLREPVVRAELDWRAAYVYGRDEKTGKDLWEDCCRRYEDFPLGENGVRESSFVLEAKHARDKKSHEIRAQMRVSRFLSAKEDAPARRGGAVSNGASSGASSGALLVVDEPETVTVTVAPTMARGASVQSTADEKDSEMLIME